MRRSLPSTGGDSRVTAPVTPWPLDAILAAPAEVCPEVSEHTDCDTLAVLFDDFGDVDWLGQALTETP